MLLPLAPQGTARSGADGDLRGRGRGHSCLPRSRSRWAVRRCSRPRKVRFESGERYLSPLSCSIERAECRPTTMPKRLLLWDIDATLVITGGAGEKRSSVSLRRVSACAMICATSRSPAGPIPALPPAFCRKICRSKPTAENVAEFLGDYLHHLEELLPRLNGRVLPGISEVLRRLHQIPDRVLALLTGHLQRGADKLRHYGSGITSSWRFRG